MNQETKSFAKNRWSGLKQTFLPSSLVSNGVLNLPSDALTVYPVLLHLHRNKMAHMQPDKRCNELFANIKVSQESLTRYTGLSINSITSGTKSLKEFGLIEVEYRRKQRNEFERRYKVVANRNSVSSGTSNKGAVASSGTNASRRKRRRRAKNPDNVTANSNVYWLLKPVCLGFERHPFEPHGEINIIPTSGIRYFSFPSCLITQHDEKWSLAKMSGSEIRLYFAICWLSSKLWKREGNDFEVTVLDLLGLSGLRSQKTLYKALDGLQYNRKLIQIWPSEKLYINGGSKTIRLELCDPLTGNPVVQDTDPHNQPSNYRLKGRRRRPTLNVFDTEDVEKAIREANDERGESLIHGANGEFMMKCPFHSDDTPSLSANSKKNGCWYCHGCKRKGNIFQLLAELRGTTIGEAIESLAATRNIEVEYQDPDLGATIYSYMTEDGKKVLKQVVTRIKNGEKVVTQRRPGPDGYICDVEGVPPSLYHVELLQGAATVCITEGEKDANTVTNLELSRWPKQVVGVTSGNWASWRPEFAKYLKGKNVVVMPDADESGKQYADAVTASLEAEGIPYRIVTFGDASCKDVSDFLLEHSVEQLVRRIGLDLISLEARMIPCDGLPEGEILF